MKSLNVTIFLIKYTSLFERADVLRDQQLFDAFRFHFGDVYKLYLIERKNNMTQTEENEYECIRNEDIEKSCIMCSEYL